MYSCTAVLMCLNLVLMDISRQVTDFRSAKNRFILSIRLIPDFAKSQIEHLIVQALVVDLPNLVRYLAAPRYRYYLGSRYSFIDSWLAHSLPLRGGGRTLVG